MLSAFLSSLLPVPLVQDTLITVTEILLHKTHSENAAVFAEWLGWRVPDHFGDVGTEYRHACDSVALIDRSYRASIDVSGDGVTKFLNGIISSETERLEIGDGQPSTFLSAKGKLLAAFHTYRIDEDRCRLRLIEPLREELTRQLMKYAFLSDIDVKSTGLATMSLHGPRSSDVLRQALGIEAPLNLRSRLVHTHASMDLAIYRANDASTGGFEIEVAPGELASLWELLTAASKACGGGVAGHQVGEILRVEAGGPMFGLDYDDNNFPAEAGLEGALSYDKCYVGQEVVARMRTYGHANRKLYGLRFAQGVPPAGTMLRSESRDVARVTSPVDSPRCGAIALGMVGRRYWDFDDRFEVETEGGNMDIELLNLPFIEPVGQESKS
jgi:aminomethyltransferase